MELQLTGRVFELIESLKKENIQVVPTNPAPQAASPAQIQGDIERNDPCPCGSGKKWKNCGLKNTEEHQRLMAAKQ